MQSASSSQTLIYILRSLIHSPKLADALRISYRAVYSHIRSTVPCNNGSSRLDYYTSRIKGLTCLYHDTQGPSEALFCAVLCCAVLCCAYGSLSVIYNVFFIAILFNHSVILYINYNPLRVECEERVSHDAPTVGALLPAARLCWARLLSALDCTQQCTKHSSG